MKIQIEVTTEKDWKRVSEFMKELERVAYRLDQLEQTTRKAQEKKKPNDPF